MYFVPTLLCALLDLATNYGLARTLLVFLNAYEVLDLHLADILLAHDDYLSNIHPAFKIWLEQNFECPKYG